MFEIGSSLREARMRHGYELAEAEAATKIRTKYLNALEEERFEVLPAPTYVKGFLHSYADFLGLDGQLYVDEYNARYGAGEDEYVVTTQPRRRPRPSRAHRRVESRVLLLALVGILSATALVVIAWKFGGADTGTVANLDSRAPAVETTSRPASPAPAVTLVLAAVDGNSLVVVRRGSAGGDVVFEGTVERGRTMRFTGKRLWLNIAAPENLAARLNGKDVALPDRAEPVVLVATKRGLAPAAS
ncbi:MAG: helix-turn-helix domain-containing protein [Gaiellaceae bacterium]